MEGAQCNRAWGYTSRWVGQRARQIEKEKGRETTNQSISGTDIKASSAVSHCWVMQEGPCMQGMYKFACPLLTACEKNKRG